MRSFLIKERDEHKYVVLSAENILFSFICIVYTYFFPMCLTACLCVYLYIICLPGACRAQKRVDLVVKMVVGCHVGAGNK